MRLSDDQYRAVRSDLIREFRSWRSNTATHDYADVVLDLRFHHDGEVLRWTAGDVERLLLEWIPGRVIVPDALWGELAGGVRDFLTYLGEAGRLAPGSDPTAALVAAVTRHAPEMARRARDPGRFGVTAGATPPPVARWEDELEPEPPHSVLPARPAADLRSAAELAASSLAFRRLCTLHEYFTEPRKLTAKGNLTLADARHLVEALETGDVMNELIGDRRFKTRSSDELRSLGSIVWFAKQARVLRVYGGKLVALGVWRPRRGYPLAVVLDLADLMVELGPLAHHQVTWYSEPQLSLLEASVPSILAGLYEAPLPFDDLAARLTAMIRDALQLEASDQRVNARLVPFWLGQIVTALADLSLIEWREPVRFEEYGRERRRGGVLAITELGVHWCQTRLADFGFVVPIGRDLSPADPPGEIVAGLADLLGSQGPDAMLTALIGLGDPDEVAAAIEGWWMVDHPAAGQVLGAIEDGIPSAKVRRAAHRARFRLRNR